MPPLQFGTGSATLFGLHDPAAAPRKRIGVVLLNPLGWEALRAHRTLRLLASRLAAAGYDALRFDYAGTGDSGGDVREVTSAAAWRRDIGQAVDELKDVAAVSRVVLVGLRAGAVLAADAVQAVRGLAHLVLWDPIAPDAPDGFGATDGALAPAPEVVAQLRTMARAPLPAGVPTTIVMTTLAGASRVPWVQQAASVVTVPGSQPCWVEERDFGAGAVPVALVDRIVAELPA